MKRKWIYFTFFLLAIINLIAASSQDEGQALDMYHLMTHLLFQLAVIIFLARVGGFFFEKIGVPSVLGELSAGILISPYLLGSIPIFGFPNGLFPEHVGSNLPISPELYGFSTFGLIILLFLAGLETDIKLLLRYSLAGIFISISGLILSFFAGVYLGMYFFSLPLKHPLALFFGLMCSVTSVGITARILSERRSMDSPEGVTIHLTTVINDVVVIILLAIVLGIYSAYSEGKQDIIAWHDIGFITLKSVVILLGVSAMGLIFSQKISSFFKFFKNKYIITFLALGLALFVSAIFEKVGLAMIIGAYVMGLSLSKTDISFLIQESLHPIERFFVPIFFAVMGMKINLGALFFSEVMVFGLLFTVVAILAKLIGCGVPSLFFNFNKLGAIRIGFGMAPRGEVALIIAGIGLSAGLLNERAFSIAILMIVFTTLIAPQVLNTLLKSQKKGVRKEYKMKGTVLIPYDSPEEEETDFLVAYILKSFQREGFFINKRALDTVIYEIRKDDVFIKLFVEPKKIVFKTSEEDASLVKAVVYEAFLKLDFTVSKLKAISKPMDMRKELVFSNTKKYKIDLTKIIDPNCIVLDLKSQEKEDVIEELVDILADHGKIHDKKQVLSEILSRETSMSTGMKNGLAIPHARTKYTESTTIAIGLSQKGIEFDSLDGQPAKVIICLVSSVKDNDPHIQILATISAFLNSKEAIIKLLSSTTQKEVWSFFLTEEQKNLIYYEYIYSSLNRNVYR